MENNMENNMIPAETPNMPECQPRADQKAIKINLKIPWTTIIIIAVVIVVAVLIYLGRGLVIAATVNGSPISRAAVVRQLERAYGKDILDSIVTEKLVNGAARAKKILISQDVIDSEIKITEDQVKAQGTTLAAALAEQGMTMNDLKARIILRKEMEQLVADKLDVTDQEIAQYIKDNKISVSKGQEASINGQVKTTLRNQKLNDAANALVEVLKSQAKIHFFVKY
jgi:foldase protein PrsA